MQTRFFVGVPTAILRVCSYFSTNYSETSTGPNKKKEKESADPSHKNPPEEADKPLEEGAAKPEEDGKKSEQSGADKNSHEEEVKRPDTTPFYAACWSTGAHRPGFFEEIKERWWSSSSGNSSAFCGSTDPTRSRGNGFGVLLHQPSDLYIPTKKPAESGIPLAVCPVVTDNDNINKKLDFLFNSGNVFPEPASNSGSEDMVSSGMGPQYAACWSTGSVFSKHYSGEFSNSGAQSTGLRVDAQAAHLTKNEPLPYPNHFFNYERYNINENRKKDGVNALANQLQTQETDPRNTAIQQYLSKANKSEVEAFKTIFDTISGNSNVGFILSNMINKFNDFLTMSTQQKDSADDTKYFMQSNQWFADVERHKHEFEKDKKNRASPMSIYDVHNFQERQEEIRRVDNQVVSLEVAGMAERITQHRLSAPVSYNEAMPSMEFSTEHYIDTPHIWRNLPKLLKEPLPDFLLEATSSYLMLCGRFGIPAGIAVKYLRDKPIEIMNKRVSEDEKHNIPIDYRRAAAIRIALDNILIESKKREPEVSSRSVMGSLKQSMGSLPEDSISGSTVKSPADRDPTDELILSKKPLGEKPR